MRFPEQTKVAFSFVYQNEKDSWKKEKEWKELTSKEFLFFFFFNIEKITCNQDYYFFKSNSFKKSKLQKQFFSSRKNVMGFRRIDKWKVESEVQRFNY